MEMLQEAGCRCLMQDDHEDQEDSDNPQTKVQ